MELLHKLFVTESMGISAADLSDLELAKLDIFSESSKFDSPYFDDFLPTGLPGLLTKYKDTNGKSPINNGYKVPGRFYLRHEPLGTFLECSFFRSSPLLGIKRSHGTYTFTTLNSVYKLELLIDD